MSCVIGVVIRIFRFTEEKSYDVVLEAHTRGLSICKTEPLEPAELQRDQLRSFSLTATVEPACG